jgi:uncharacterized protein YfeS
MEIYIVEGRTGEYSDFRKWIVCAYLDKNKAEERAKNAGERAKELELEDFRYKKYDEDAPFNEFDEGMDMDYTGTEYIVYPIEVADWP